MKSSRPKKEQDLLANSVWYPFCPLREIFENTNYTSMVGCTRITESLFLSSKIVAASVSRPKQRVKKRWGAKSGQILRLMPSWQDTCSIDLSLNFLCILFFGEKVAFFLVLAFLSRHCAACMRSTHIHRHLDRDTPQNGPRCTPHFQPKDSPPLSPSPPVGGGSSHRSMPAFHPSYSSAR